MRKIYYLILGVIVLVFLDSCSPSLQQHNQNQIQQARDYWIGESESTLIQSWGPPNQRTSDGDGGQILTYNRYNGYITWVTNFYVNSDKIIYNLNAHSE